MAAAAKLVESGVGVLYNTWVSLSQFCPWLPSKKLHVKEKSSNVRTSVSNNGKHTALGCWLFFLQDNREMDSDDFQESEAGDDSNLTNAVSFACHWKRIYPVLRSCCMEQAPQLE